MNQICLCTTLWRISAACINTVPSLSITKKGWINVAHIVVVMWDTFPLEGSLLYGKGMRVLIWETRFPTVHGNALCDTIEELHLMSHVRNVISGRHIDRQHRRQYLLCRLNEHDESLWKRRKVLLLQISQSYHKFVSVCPVECIYISLRAHISPFKRSYTTFTEGLFMAFLAMTEVARIPVCSVAWLVN